MSKPWQWLSGSLLVLMIVGGPIAWSNYRKAHFRNFQPVQAGVLYRSGQLSLDGLKRVVHDHGIKTVVTLRSPKDEGSPLADDPEDKYCQSQSIKFHRLPFWKSNGRAPDETNVARFVAIMDDPNNYPVLVHCFAGKHRTGLFVAVWRMEKQHWSNAEAIAELEARGYDHLREHEDVDGFLKSYVPRWKQRAGAEEAEPPQ